MLIIGIDPGINGGICAIDYESDRFDVVDVRDIPTLGDAAKREIDDLALIKWLKSMNADHAYIELVTPMPSLPDKDGRPRPMGSASSNFKLGFTSGQIRTCVRG